MKSSMPKLTEKFEPGIQLEAAQNLLKTFLSSNQNQPYQENGNEESEKRYCIIANKLLKHFPFFRSKASN